MKLSTREDVDAPVERVWQALSDAEGFERSLGARGVEIAREGSRRPAPGTRWRAVVPWRGRVHEVEAELVEAHPREGWTIEARGSGVVALAQVELTPLGEARTRLAASVDMRPTTLSARLLIQSLRLARARLSRRFAERVACFARRL